MAQKNEAKTEGRAAAPGRPRFWFQRYPVATFLVTLALAFCAAPFEEQLPDGNILEVVPLMVVLLTGLLTLSDRRTTLVWGLVLVTPALAGRLLHHGWPEQAPAWAFLVPALLFIGFVQLHLLRFILRAPRIDSEVLCAGVAGYLMLGLCWALAYVLTARLVPDSFFFTVGPVASHAMKGFTALYYSFLTLTTVGYGDIVPVTGVARMLAMMEAVLGTLYMAMLVARLVSLYSSEPPPASEPPRPAGD